MSRVDVPSGGGALPPLLTRPEAAADMAADLRSVAVGVENAQAWATRNSAPGWSGAAADAHAHTLTRFGARLELGEAALERAVTAADRLRERVAVLQTDRDTLAADRAELDADREALQAEIEAAVDDLIDGAVVPARDEEFRRRAERLAVRLEEWQARVQEWTTRRDDADADFVAALARVDSAVEAEAVAAAPGRPDVEALVAKLIGLLAGAGPAAVAPWWRRLTRAQQQAVIAEHPQLVGNAGGIPAQARDQANRATIRHQVAYLTERERDGQLDRSQRRVLNHARTVTETVDDAEARVRDTEGSPPVMVLTYHPQEHGGDGGVAVSVGDPDHTDRVAVNIPGFTTETEDLPGLMDRVIDLHDVVVADGDGTVATIVWTDYDAPSGNPLLPWERMDYAGVLTGEKAAAGGERLIDFIDGLRGSDDGERAHVVAIGHSYGSSTLGYALDGGAAVDTAVLLGSPGVHEESVEDLTDAEVWVGSMDNDPITLIGDGEHGGLGVLGQDPASEEFGGRRFETGDGSPLIGDWLDNHSGYYEGPALDNLGHIVAGNDDEVIERPGRGEDDDPPTLDDLISEGTTGRLEDWLDGQVDSLTGRWGRLG